MVIFSMMDSRLSKKSKTNSNYIPMISGITYWRVSGDEQTKKSLLSHAAVMLGMNLVPGWWQPDKLRRLCDFASTWKRSTLPIQSGSGPPSADCAALKIWNHY